MSSTSNTMAIQSAPVPRAAPLVEESMANVVIPCGMTYLLHTVDRTRLSERSIAQLEAWDTAFDRGELWEQFFHLKVIHSNTDVTETQHLFLFDDFHALLTEHGQPTGYGALYPTLFRELVGGHGIYFVSPPTRFKIMEFGPEVRYALNCFQTEVDMPVKERVWFFGKLTHELEMAAWEFTNEYAKEVLVRHAWISPGTLDLGDWIDVILSRDAPRKLTDGLRVSFWEKFRVGMCEVERLWGLGCDEEFEADKRVGIAEIVLLVGQATKFVTAVRAGTETARARERRFDEMLRSLKLKRTEGRSHFTVKVAGLRRRLVEALVEVQELPFEERHALATMLTGDTLDELRKTVAGEYRQMGRWILMRVGCQVE